MNIIFEGNNYDIINKYSNYYIRFMGGSMMPIPCDIKITEREKDDVLIGKRDIEELIQDYMKIIPWTENEFINRGFKEYFINKFNMSEEEIEKTMIKLSTNRALRNEMYISIMNEGLPINCWAKVNGMSAKEYSKKFDGDLDKTYMYMVSCL